MPMHRLQIDCLEVFLYWCTIMSSKCISNLARSQPASVSLNSLNYVLQVHITMASTPISKLAWSRPPNAFPNSHDHGRQVHLQTLSITAAKCISKLTRLWAPNPVLHSLNCVFCKLRQCLSNPGFPKYILPVAESISVIPLFPDVYIERLR
jgi:hypothetical protein